MLVLTEVETQKLKKVAKAYLGYVQAVDEAGTALPALGEAISVRASSVYVPGPRPNFWVPTRRTEVASGAVARVSDCLEVQGRTPQPGVIVRSVSSEEYLVLFADLI